MDAQLFVEAIKAKLEEDAELNQLNPAEQLVNLELVSKLPEALSRHLDLPVTLENLLAARAIVLLWRLRLEHPKRLTEAASDHRLGYYTPEVFQHMIDESIAHELDEARSLVARFNEYGVPESTLILSEKFRLNAEARHLYLSGNFQIEELLLVDPMVMLRLNS